MVANTLPAMTDHQLDALAAEINVEHRAVVAALDKAMEHAISAGQKLIQAKAGMQHGQWGKWLADHFEFSDRTARTYMQVASGKSEARIRFDDHASIRGAVRQLSDERKAARHQPKDQNEPLVDADTRPEPSQASDGNDVFDGIVAGPMDRPVPSTRPLYLSPSPKRSAEILLSCYGAAFLQQMVAVITKHLEDGPRFPPEADDYVEVDPDLIYQLIEDFEDIERHAFKNPSLPPKEFREACGEFSTKLWMLEKFAILTQDDRKKAFEDLKARPLPLRFATQPPTLRSRF